MLATLSAAGRPMAGLWPTHMNTFDRARVDRRAETVAFVSLHNESRAKATMDQPLLMGCVDSAPACFREHGATLTETTNMIFPHSAARTGFLRVALGAALTTGCSIETLPGTVGEPIGLQVDAADSGVDRQWGETGDDGGHAASDNARPDGWRFVAARLPEIGSRLTPSELVSVEASVLPPEPVYAPLGRTIER